jgi:hypothetical protein
MAPETGATDKEDTMARRTLTGSLYRAARLSATGRAIRTGKVGRRTKNIAVGRALGRAGFWSRLWR